MGQQSRRLIRDEIARLDQPLAGLHQVGGKLPGVDPVLTPTPDAVGYPDNVSGVCHA